MATINKLDNYASITYAGNVVQSNTVETLLDLPPTILKAVDKLIVSVGDTLTYTVTITNIALSSIASLPFADTLPEGCEYVADSFKVNTVAATPTLTGNTLSYTIPSITALGVATIQFQVDVIGGNV